jgi:hypothetical protein
MALLPEEVRGFDLLSGFWDHVWPLAQRPVRAAIDGLSREPAVLGAAAHPSGRMQFVLLAGKGGVGKTTLSCATAMRLARDLPGKRVLLFSTDPAHSLSACLHVPIGSRPAVIFPGLTAMEIDAKAEFEKLKTRYAQDLERFLESVSRGFDLTFDRVVLERMLDLSPPGLDEVMALTRILEFLAQGRYDLFRPGLRFHRPPDPPAGTPGADQPVAEGLLQLLPQVRAHPAIARIHRRAGGDLPEFEETPGTAPESGRLGALCREHSHPDGARGNHGPGGGLPPDGHRRPARIPEPDDAAVRLPLVFEPAAAGTAGGGGFPAGVPGDTADAGLQQPEIAGLERLEKLGRCLYQPARPRGHNAPELAAPELVIL